MNLTLHQFRKEARYLLPHWLLWLVVLATDLTMDAEWVMPMRSDGSEPMWYALIPILMWGGAIWLALSFPPEDAYADDRSFIAVKPLPRRCYWAARSLVLFSMILVPLVVFEGFYLGASHRPSSDVLIGMFERAFLAGALLGWLLPMPALASGWRRYAVVGMAAFTGIALQFATIELIHRCFRHYFGYAQFLFLNDKIMQAAYFGVAGMVLLAWLQGRCRWTFARLLTAVAANVAACLVLACSPLVRPWSQGPRDPALIAELESRHHDSLTPDSIVINWAESRDKRYAGHELGLEADISVPSAPASLLPLWMPQHSKASQGGTALPQTESSSFWLHPFLKDSILPGIFMMMHDHPQAPRVFSSAARPNVLSADNSGWWSWHPLQLGNFRTLAGPEVPVEVTSEQQAIWLKYTPLGSEKLKVGTKISSPWSEVEIVAIKTNVDAADKPRPGAVTLVIKLGTRALETHGSPFPYWLQTPMALYDPAKRMVWQRMSFGDIHASRAIHSGWMRGVYSMTWDRVIGANTGIAETNLGNLELLMTHQEYAGTSYHTISLHDLKPADHVSSPFGWPELSTPLVTSHPREALLESLTRIPKPPLDAPRQDVARYAAKVCVVAQSLHSRLDKNDDGTDRWPGNDRAAADLLAPYVLRHPDIFTHLRHIGGLGSAHFMLQVLRATLGLVGLPSTVADTASPSGPKMDLVARVDLTPESWKEFAPAFEQALAQKTVEPLVAVQTRWRALAAERLSDEALFERLRKNDSYTLWSLLKNRPDAVPKAREIIRKRYYWESPPGGPIRDGIRQITITAVSAGLSEAFDYALRQTALLDDSKLSHNDHEFLSHLSQTLGGKELAWQELPGFVRTVRSWNAGDFIYDEASFTWKRKTQF